MLKQDEQVYLSNSSTYMKRIAIGDDNARQDVFCQCLNHMEMNGCRVLGKVWVRLLEPNMKTWYP